MVMFAVTVVVMLTAVLPLGAHDMGELADPLFDGGRVIRLGDRGLDVERLQEVLNQIGYPVGTADGIFGPLTDSGVRKFQSDRRLTVDGLVGGATRASLKSSLSTNTTPASSGTLREGSRGDEVRRLQDLLNDQGFPPGPIDGIFGPRTVIAVMSFQETRGLRVDGIAGPETLGALGTQSDSPASGYSPQWPPNDGGKRTVEKWRSTVSQYWPADREDCVLGIIYLESRGDATAHNRSSDAMGLMQHLLRYWPMRARGAGFVDGDGLVADPFNGEANIAAGAWLADYYDGRGLDWWRPWSSLPTYGTCSS
jgi:peptidoglycan hydrolase-like protein with peptidoglycan-binding domain